MKFLQRLFSSTQKSFDNPRAQMSGGVFSETISDALTSGRQTKAGQFVTDHNALSVAAVFGCIRTISTPVSTLPLHLKRETADGKKTNAVDLPLWNVLTRRPNRWQTPSTFRRMLMWSVLNRGDAICKIQRDTRGRIIELVPLNRDRVTVNQLANTELEYEYRKPNGGVVKFSQNNIFRLVGYTLDGVNAVSPLTFAREAVGLSLAQDQHGADTFRNGANVGQALMAKTGLSPEAASRLRESVDEYRNGQARAGGTLVLEDGVEIKEIGMSLADAEWLESRKFSQSQIAMFFGVPPHMLGDTEKATSWGAGIEQQTNAFLASTLEHYLTMWEEAINFMVDDDPEVFARFNRSALVQSDIETRHKSHASALQWGWKTVNEVRSLEDLNPLDGGDVRYPPPNMTGDFDPKDDGAESNNRGEIRDIKAVA